MRENKRLGKTIGYGILMVILLTIVISFISIGSYKIATKNKQNNENVISSYSTLGEVIEYISDNEIYDDQYITDVMYSSKEISNAVDSLENPTDLVFEVKKLKKTIDINNSIITPNSFNKESLDGILITQPPYKFTFNLTNSVFIISDGKAGSIIGNEIGWNKITINSTNSVVIMNDATNNNKEYLSKGNFTNSILNIRNSEYITTESIFNLQDDLYRGMKFSSNSYLDIK